LTDLAWIVVLVLWGVSLGSIVVYLKRNKITTDFKSLGNNNRPEMLAPSEPMPDFIGSSFSVPLNHGDEYPRCLSVTSLSARGYSHFEQEIPRQDSHTIFRKHGQTFFAVSDGVSSASRSHFGSELAVRKLPGIIAEVFSGLATSEITRWVEVNRKLSTTLVKASIERNDKSSDSSALRLKAAELFATTMEILVIQETVNEAGNNDFIYIRLAGDGGLVKVTKNRISNVLDRSGNFVTKTTNMVSALPVNDVEPYVIAGELMKGETLLLSTDGFTEALWMSSDLKAFFTDRALGTLDFDDSLEAMSLARKSSADDLTLISISSI
jgi:serine/threonine protein phosphatase PrpC